MRPLARRCGAKGAVHGNAPAFGQQELVDLHHYTYDIDLHAMLGQRHPMSDRGVTKRVNGVNEVLADHVHFS